MLLSLQQQQQQQSPSTLTSPSQNHTINIPNSATATPNPNNVDKSDSGYVDYMNLYIKNLDPVVTNNDLFNMFRKFGRIISARVMSNPQTGQSKGYGFVSYDKEEEASAALQEMNGKLIGAKQLIVAYHEPKKPRQEKQGNSTTTTTNNNNISSNNNNGNQHHHHPTATSPVTTTSTNNAMQQPFMVPSQVNGLGIDNVDQIAMTMKSPNFGQHPLRLSPPFSTSPMSGVSSTGPSLASLASGLNVQPRPNTMGHSPQLQSQPHSSSSPQPQQQQSQQPMDFRNNGRPTLRRKGSLESISSVMTESSASMQRQRLMEAVMRCGDYGKAVSDIVDMLLTLKRKERSLCLFNQDFLKEKIQLALDALDTFNDDDDDEDGDVDVFDHTIPMTSVAPLVRQQPQQRVSKAIPIVAPPPEPVVPPTTTPATTTTTTTNNATIQQIEQLLVSLDGKPTHEKKQQLGDRLFPLVKATGTKQAPKVTIRLLDTIDLHELAHLMYDKDQLKERVEVAFASLK
ncbi:hypothetical protein BDA99DRAFT_447621 [Phascolomyces articulosus]|uniref:Polyadenylate-binding protein, cytoplasmic and nuclear n=1 Tax=Phascolomyces articulosus TaxID=60185 RepID=A0AAD5P7X1_9FUNG|nr:hypothetical protein BDA99DRAFT_447621 [Phascolomyces articulosus]